MKEADISSARGVKGRSSSSYYMREKHQSVQIVHSFSSGVSIVWTQRHKLTQVSIKIKILQSSCFQQKPETYSNIR